MRYDELRGQYEVLAKLKKVLKDCGASKQVLSKAGNDIKQRIRYDRDYNHDDPLEVSTWRYGTIGFDNKRHLEDFDDSCSRYRMYGVDYIVEDIEEFEKENRTNWYNPYEDGRDCTGVWFTTLMHVVPIPKAGFTVVIEYQGMDV